jgi:hypothetical protein
VPTDSGNVVRHSITRAPYVTLAIYISRNSTGNMTPFQVFSFWKFPWKYDLLWRQKLQETGISNRFPAVSTVSDAFHPTSRAEKSPRPLIFSFYASFLGGKSLNTKIASIECLRTSMWGRAKGKFQWKVRGPLVEIEWWKSTLSSWKCRPKPTSIRIFGAANEAYSQ